MSAIEIRQRTTPTHTFELGLDTSLLSALEITYKQNGVVLLSKDLDDVTLDGENVTLALTEEETAAFGVTGNVGIQVWAKDAAGVALLSDIFDARVYPAQSPYSGGGDPE